MPRLYLSPPHLGGDEADLVAEAFDSNWIAPLGPHVDSFETEMCSYLGGGYATALSSGTGALHLALVMLGVGGGDFVLCSSFTFAATANAITYCGAVPVFVDSEPSSWNMDPALFAQAVEDLSREGSKPKAAIVVDLYGQCADYETIGAVAKEHGVPLIEDAAESLGATHRGVAAGRLAELAVLSFNGNKIITTGGGGMLLAREKRWTDRARFLATQARDPAPHYQHSEIGYNYRLSNLLAAVGRGQLRVLDRRVARRREINRAYREGLGDLPGLSFMPEAEYGTCTFWLTCITLDPEAFGATREDVRLALERMDIESRPLWKPMHIQPVFAECRSFGGRFCEGLFERGLCLPSGTAMSGREQERVIEVIQKACLAA